MKGINVKRAQWSFAELAARYGVKPDSLDLRRAVIDGVLPVRLWVKRDDAMAVSLDEGRPVADSSSRYPLSGYFYPVRELGDQFDTWDFSYQVFSDAPALCEDAQLWALPEPVTLSALLALGVVFDEDRQAAEDAVKKNPLRPLSAREENTRDRLLIALAVEHYGWDPAGERSSGATAISAVCKANGLDVSFASVKEHLRSAWDRCQPKLADSPAA